MPPLGLCDLPIESLTAIFRLVDLTSVKCLARTCDRLNDLAQDFLFEHIDFHLNRSDRELIDPDFQLSPRLIGLRFDRTDTLVLARLFLERHKSSDFGRVLCRLDDLFGYQLFRIRSVKLSSAAVTAQLAIHLLYLTSCKLRTLEVVRPRMENWDNFRGTEWIEEAALDIALLREHLANSRPNPHSASHRIPRLYLPALTHVKLGKGSVPHPEFLTLLCKIAPNIIWLSAALTDNRGAQNWQPCQGFDRTFLSITKLKELSITHWDVGDGPDNLVRVRGMYIDLLAKSPDIKRLSMNYSDGYGGDMYHASPSYSVLRQISLLPKLVSLYWRTGKRLMTDFQDPREFKGLKEIKRLVLWREDVGYDQSEKIPILPFLESIHLCYRVWPWHMIRRAAIDLDQSRNNSMRLQPGFAAWLRTNDCLHTVRWFKKPYDDGEYADSQTLLDCEAAEKDGNVSCRIFSIRHGDAEILHCRQFLQDVELYTSKFLPANRYEEGKTNRTGFLYLPYCHGWSQQNLDWLDAHDIPIYRYQNHHAPTWRYFGDLDGRHVPGHVLERMKRAEGLSLAEWEKRGVRVSEATWNILCRYLAKEMELLSHVRNVAEQARQEGGVDRAVT